MSASLASPTTANWSQFEPVLARLRADAVTHFGTAEARLVPVQHEERPFSHLLRVAVCRGGAGTPDLHLFVKLFKPKADLDTGTMQRRVAQDFEISQRIFAAFDSPSGAGVVRPVACYVDQLAIVSEEAPGVTLMAHLDEHARWFPSPSSLRSATDALTGVGRWLRSFQRIEPGTGRVVAHDLRDYIDVRLQRLVARNIYSAARRAAILQHLDELAHQVDAHELSDVIIHADLAPGNILVCGPRVIVLDFAMVQRGCSLHDITRLWVQLDVLRAKPQFRMAVIQQLQQALLAGFDEALTVRRPLFRYLVMLHRINHFSSLSSNRERFLARALSTRVRQLHTSWIETELATHASARVDARA